jgi:hypothetical protein
MGLEGSMFANLKIISRRLLPIIFSTSDSSVNSRSKDLRIKYKPIVLVRILYQNPHSNADSDNFYISIPKDWSGATDEEVTVIVDDVCVVVPQTIAGATGELIVLRLLEAMIDGDIIDAGDVQKAVEHIL